MAALPPLRAPPPNPYFLQGAAADVPRPLMEAVVERRGGVRVLQLPGCAEGGFRSFVDGIACAAPPGEVLGGGRCRPMRTRLRPRMCGAIGFVRGIPKCPFLVAFEMFKLFWGPMASKGLYGVGFTLLSPALLLLSA